MDADSVTARPAIRPQGPAVHAAATCGPLPYRALVLVLAVAVGVLASCSRPAHAGAPSEYIKERIEKVYDLVGAAGSVEAASPDRRTAARKVLDEMFDWTEMGRRTLEKHWSERSSAERAEFVRLFSELFQRTYLSRIHLAEREKFQFLGDTIEGDRASVKTKVITKKGQEIPVDYLTARSDGDRWKIYDLDVSGVSLIGNYRAQFASLIGRSSYSEFIGKLKALVEKRSSGPRRDGFVLVGAGDIASCLGEGDEATARLLDSIDGVVFTLGDNAYEAGTAIEFEACYEPSWGRHKARTRPAAGNHDYGTAAASGYFDYFGAAAGDSRKGYYGYDVGPWRVIVLNSNCAEVGGCEQGSPQEQWLRAELTAHPRRCTLAYWHHARFSSGPNGSDPSVDAFWRALYDHGVEVALAGHDHLYERFAPQTPDGAADQARGIRQFVVGTGGARLYPFAGPPIANSEVRNDNTFGVLKLTVRPASYDWQFVPVAGRTFTDSGTGRCH